MSRYLWPGCVALLLCVNVRAEDPPATAGQPAVTREQVPGAFRFPSGYCLRITGKVKVIDAHTLEFADSKQIELNGGMDAPDLAQFGLIDNVLYPCGREAADFLQKLIGDRPVVCYVDDDNRNKPRGDAYLGETRIETEMVRNGWAISDHSGTESLEIIARENKRGLWRGTFMEMGKWRKGERLPGEPAANSAQQRALAALHEADPLIKLDLDQPDRPVVAIHFRPNYGPVKDDDLAHLAAFPHLKSVRLANKSKITDAGIAHLAVLEELEDVDLNNTKVTPAGVVQLVHKRMGLKRLNLTGVPFGNDHLAALKDLVNLEDLSLRGTLVTDEGLRHLAPFTRLKSLSLMSTRVSDAGLPILEHLTELEDLDLDRTAITDAGLKHLSGLVKLRRLQMARTAVTDAGLVHLERLEKLQSLNPGATKVTLAGLTRLQQVLPLVNARKGPDPTATIIGEWDAIDHHAAIGSLYQPVHGARQRDSKVYFQQTIDGLVGYAIHEGHAAISYQERWKDGRTNFKDVDFANGQLVFVFDIGEWRKGAGPLAVEAGKLENKGTIRVEAALEGDRLIGKWSMLTADGAEVYRGQWQATRAKAQEPPPGAAAEGPPPTEGSQIVRDTVSGSIFHLRQRERKPAWRRIMGPVKVLDAQTLEFSDGTRIDLDIVVPLPKQMAMNGDVLYPAGKEAAEFLRKLVADRTVMCIRNDRGDGPWMAWVGDQGLERAMIVNGWALADHSSLHGDEIIARENKRGLWRGKFILPPEWSAGARLPGEP